MRSLYVSRKYNGDDLYSWAIFRTKDLTKGHRGIVFYGEATPVVSGMDRREASWMTKDLNMKVTENDS